MSLGVRRRLLLRLSLRLQQRVRQPLSLADLRMQNVQAHRLGLHLGPRLGRHQHPYATFRRRVSRTVVHPAVSRAARRGGAGGLGGVAAEEDDGGRHLLRPVVRRAVERHRVRALEAARESGRLDRLLGLELGRRLGNARHVRGGWLDPQRRDHRRRCHRRVLRALGPAAAAAVVCPGHDGRVCVQLELFGMLLELPRRGHRRGIVGVGPTTSGAHRTARRVRARGRPSLVRVAPGGAHLVRYLMLGRADRAFRAAHAHKDHGCGCRAAATAWKLERVGRSGSGAD
mmetsp:Transcript_40475/g.108370  ORF Transcript_40475/g.108370 Transcript_40475/m.108370 type:complete len:286 (-) Transcript_40475:396-1253(-)